MSWLKRLSFTHLCIAFLVLLPLALAGSLTLMELRAEEPRRAIVAMEMLMSKEWIVPKVHGSFYYNKPPLFNWLLAASFWITGSFSEFAVRLPSLLSFLLTGYCVYRIVKHYINKKAGVIAAFFFLTSADILFYGAVNTGEIDLFFTLLVFLQAIAIFHYSQKQQWLTMFVLSYLATAIGILTKFLPALLFQGITLLVWLTYTKQFKKLFSLQHVIGVAGCIVISGSYFYAYSTRADIGKLVINLINESTQRSGFESDGTSSLLSFLQSPLLLFYTTLPGSLMLLYIFNKRVRKAANSNPLIVFAILFFVFNVPVYIITSKIRNRYLYPLFPFAAIFFAGIYYTATLQPKLKYVVSYKTIASICIVMLLARIGYNIWGIPYQQKTSAQLMYRKLTSEIFAFTGNKPIHITGTQDTLFANPALPFVHIDADTLLIPPFISQQIPYYCMRHNKAIMQYDKEPKNNVFYLVPVNDLPSGNVTVYKQFEDWEHKKFALAVYH